MSLGPGVGIATYNLGHARLSRVVNDLEALADAGASVLCLQEAGDRGRELRAFLKRRPTWRMFRSHRPGGHKVPVLWDEAALTVIARSCPLAVPRSWVGPEGAGPTRIEPKRLTRVKLRHHATGIVFTVVGTHFVPSATRHDLPPAEHTARRRHFRAHVDAILALSSRIAGPVIVGADVNAPPSFELLAPMHAYGFAGWTQRPTIHGKPVDHVTIRGRLLIGPAQILELSSDHRAVLRSFYRPA